MREPGVHLRRALAAAVVLWVGRWAVLELASRVSRRLPVGPPPLQSRRQPGRLPGPFDR